MHADPLAPELQIIGELLPSYQDMSGGLLPLLHAVQDALGHIPPAAVPMIAQAFHLSRAEVHGVITFYHFFRSTPPGKHVVQICRAEACQANGSDSLLTHSKNLLGCDLHETSADGRFTLEPVYCLGLCASSPAIQVNDKLFARMDNAKLSRVVAELENQP